MATSESQRQVDSKREAAGWFQITVLLFLFPLLFFLCVFFPIWVGWTPRW